MVQGAKCVYVCTDAGEGPWVNGDTLYVDWMREHRAITKISVDGDREYFGCHWMPTLFRDLHARHVHTVWVRQDCKDLFVEYLEAVAETPPPIRLAQ